MSIYSDYKLSLSGFYDDEKDQKKTKNSVRYPTQERSRATVDAILEATAQILVKEGHAKVSTNAIAERAGVSIGGLYQYFANREAILREICLRERSDDFAALKNALEEIQDVSIQVVIERIFSTALERFAKNPELRKILDMEVNIRGKDPRMKQIRKQLSVLLVKCLGDFGYRNLPSDMELRLEVMIAGFEGSFYAALELYGKDLDQQSFMQDSAQMILTYLRKFDGVEV